MTDAQSKLEVSSIDSNAYTKESVHKVINAFTMSNNETQSQVDQLMQELKQLKDDAIKTQNKIELLEAEQDTDIKQYFSSYEKMTQIADTKRKAYVNGVQYAFSGGIWRAI